ncbi:hydroxymethylglutaryl-CoA lyase, mitochondrial-like isoform X2 [Gordionus sp. m RMFG-2023]
MRGINRHEGIIYSALVPNMTGFKKALDCQVDEIAVFGAVSETFCKKNINCSIEDSFKRFTPVIEAAKKANLRVRGYVSCIIGCPYEGPIHPRKSASIISRMLTMGCYEVSLGDTIGSGSPDSWRTLINMCYQEFGIPLSKMAVHCHDISGGAAAIDNIEAALEMGITTIDSSTGGIGGCPYADGIARGNVPTEDVIHKLNQLHLNTGVDVDKVLDAGNFICKILNIQNISRYASLKH